MLIERPQPQLARQRLLEAELAKDYRRLAAAGAAALVGIGLCGTDKSVSSMGGAQSLYGALILVPTFVVLLYLLGDVAILRYKLRKVRVP